MVIISGVKSGVVMILFRYSVKKVLRGDWEKQWLIRRFAVHEVDKANQQSVVRNNRVSGSWIYSATVPSQVEIIC
jgi:hypothetical protein